MKTKYRIMKTYLIIAFISTIIIGIAYAALSATLDVTFGNVTQNVLTWNVGFDTTTSTSATVGGTSATGRSCGTLTLSSSSVTVSDTTLSKPDDSCRWTLKIKNTGTIAAKLTAISSTSATGTNVTCTVPTANKAQMVCGNITYSITTNTTGTTVLTTGAPLASNGSRTVYLFAKYTGEGVNATAVTQSGATFTIVYSQA